MSCLIHFGAPQLRHYLPDLRLGRASMMGSPYLLAVDKGDSDIDKRENAG
jgi:hypothetical protein